jgi:hypothetical protein
MRTPSPKRARLFVLDLQRCGGGGAAILSSCSCGSGAVLRSRTIFVQPLVLVLLLAEAFAVVAFGLEQLFEVRLAVHLREQLLKRTANTMQRKQ